MEVQSILNEFFTQSNDSVVITSADPADGYGVLLANPAFCKMTGYSLAELQGRPLKLLQGPETDEKVIEQLRICLREGKYFAGSTVNYRKDRSCYIVRWSVSPIYDSRGNLTNFVSVQQDISQAKEQEAKLQEMAYFDALTKLANRAQLSDRLHQAISLAERSGRILAVCYLDLDGFKPINDTYGHQVGDLLLIEMAKRFKELVRSGDTVARVGGDEFIFLLDLGKSAECEHVIQRLLEVINQPVEIEGASMSVSASIGITLYPTDHSAPDVLIRHADQAMYQAKQMGKNRFHVFDSEHDSKVDTKI